MKTIRNVPRAQRAAYVVGSVKAGFFEYEVNGYEIRGATRGTFGLTGRAEFSKGDARAAQGAREEAVKAAWRSARAWVSELGQLTCTESDLSSEADT